MAKTKRQEDAESIVGKANAELLEAGDQELVGRSADDIDPNAIVERKHKSGDDEYEADDAADEDEDEDENGEDKKKKKKGPPFGGAKSLADAEAFVVERAGGDPILLDSLNVLAGVLTNIAGAEHGEAIATELADYQTRIDAITLRTLNSVQEALENGKEVPMPEETVVVEPTPQAEVTEAEAAPVAAEAEAQPEAEVETGEQEHVLAPVFASLQAAYDQARETPADQAVRLKMLQEPLNEFAAALKANIGGNDAPNASAAMGGITPEQLTQAVAAAVAPLAAELQSLKSASAVAPVVPVDPVRRALQVTSLGVGQSGPPASVTIPEAEFGNPKSDHNITPGIRNLVRRTVGLDGR